MKRLILAVISAGLLLLPIAANAGYDSGNASTPPISQALVREGDYAVKLVAALNIGSVEDETQAEDILATTGVAPNSGWISDFPVTPDIITEIQASIDTAADAGKLPMDRDDAEKAFFAMNDEIGLSITPAASTEPANEQAAPYNEPAVINNYYYDEGPPVVTYYAPPPDYLYLYAWDPFPFWCNGFFFPGFFVLSDFNFVFIDRDDFHHGHHHDGHHQHFVTNHVVDPVSHRSVAIDPVAKRPLAQTAFRPVGGARGSFDPIAKTGGTHDRRVLGSIKGGTFDRTSATNLLGRSVNRPDSGSGTWSRGRAVTPATKSGTQWVRTETVPSMGEPSRSGSFNSGATRGFNRPSSGFSKSSGDRLNGAPASRSFNQPAMNQGRSFGSPPVSSGRSINAPSAGGWGRISEVGRSFGEVGGGRSFSAPSVGGGRSFSAPSGGGRSFSAPSGGGGHSFGGGSFSAPSGGGGRSFGGGSFSAPSGGGGRSFGGGGFGGMKGR